MISSKNILLTGATGFLGGLLLVNLLQKTPHTIYCLVRSSKKQKASERLHNRLKKLPFLQEEEMNRLHLLEGDLSVDGLGLGDFCNVQIEEVFHCAAVLQFEHHKKDETIETNFNGLLRLLRFMNERNIALINFVSTAYVAGKACGNIPEEIYLHTAETNNPYELSKRMCEAEIITQHNKNGLQYRILRPSVIVGDSTTFKSESNSGLSGYLSILLNLKEKMELKIPDYFKFNELKLLIRAGASLNLICVDHVVELILLICHSKETINDIFHLVNPYPNQISESIATIGEAYGIRMAPVYNKEELGPIDYLLWAEEDIFSTYLEAVQHFECEKTYRVTGLNKNMLRIDREREIKLVLNIKEKYDNDVRVRRKRLKSIVHRFKSSILERRGFPPITYYSGGKGFPLVILNAYGQSLAFWDGIVSQLEKKFKVIIWSMRGTSSQFGGVNEVYSLEIHRDDIKSILDAEGETRCTILAWCTGPKIGLAFQSTFPQCVESMIFLNGCFKGISQFTHLHTTYENDMQEICGRIDSRPEITPFVIQTLKNILSNDANQISYDVLTDDKKRNLIYEILGLISKDIKPMVIEPFLSPQSALNYGRQLLHFWRKDVYDEVKNCSVPLLFVTGTEDKIASHRMSEAVAELSPLAACTTIRGGSHYLQYSYSELLTEIICKFSNAPYNFHFKHGLVSMKERQTLVTK